MLAWKPLGVPRVLDCDTDDSQKTYLKLSLTYTTVSSCLPGGKNSLFHFPDFIYPSLLTLTQSPPGKGILGNAVPASPQQFRGDFRKRGDRDAKMTANSMTQPLDLLLPGLTGHLSLRLRLCQPLLCHTQRVYSCKS